MPYTNTPPGGAAHGPSIKNPAVYEALMRGGRMSKGQAAAISNAQLAKTGRRGRHHGHLGRRRRAA